MILCDVNVLLAAFRPELSNHALSAKLIDSLVNGSASYAWNSTILATVVRIDTNPRVFQVPSHLEEVLAFCDSIKNSPNAVQVEPGANHWNTFEGLLKATGIRGKHVTDVHHAALAVEHGCTFVTWDKEFARFPRLQLLSVADASG